MSARSLRWSLLSALSLSCAPLTFSNEPIIDFAAYPRVRVVVAGPHGSERHGQYLEAELAEYSGFQRVTRDRAEAVDAELLVELTMSTTDPNISYSSDEGFDFDGSTFVASVLYQFQASSGVRVDSGAETSQEEDESSDAAESALDLVVLHYFRPYRL